MILPRSGLPQILLLLLLFAGQADAFVPHRRPQHGMPASASPSSTTTLSAVGGAAGSSGTSPPLHAPDKRRRAGSLASLRHIPRVAASKFLPRSHYWRSTPGGCLYETPVLVEGALSELECERWCDNLIARAGDVEVEVQRKIQLEDEEHDEDGGSGSPTTELFRMALIEALDAMMDSSHRDARFVFCEGLLDDLDLADMRERLASVREELFRRDAGVGEKKDGGRAVHEDLFDLFPPTVRPTDCVVLAGEGATSTLHRDPFEWTGTSLCLEGSKLWRFIPPPGAVAGMESTDGIDREDGDYEDSGVGVIDEALGAYRLTSVAWDDDHDGGVGEGGGGGGQLPLSAGWQSDLSLFARRDDSAVPSARSLAEMECGDDDGVDASACAEATAEKRWLLDALATDVDALRPDVTVGEDGAVPTPWAAVQRAGDLLVIPAHWWHQAYALEPSVAVASQRCGTEGRDGARVIRHVLEMAKGAIRTLWDDDFAEGVEEDLPVILRRALHNPDRLLDDPQKIVSELFDFLTTLRR